MSIIFSSDYTYPGVLQIIAHVSVVMEILIIWNEKICKI